MILVPKVMHINDIRGLVCFELEVELNSSDVCQFWFRYRFQCIKKQTCVFYFPIKNRKLCQQGQLVSIIRKNCRIWLKLTKPSLKIKSDKFRQTDINEQAYRAKIDMLTLTIGFVFQYLVWYWLRKVLKITNYFTNENVRLITIL